MNPKRVPTKSTLYQRELKERKYQLGQLAYEIFMIKLQQMGRISEYLPFTTLDHDFKFAWAESAFTIYKQKETRIHIEKGTQDDKTL